MVEHNGVEPLTIRMPCERSTAELSALESQNICWCLNRYRYICHGQKTLSFLLLCCIGLICRRERNALVSSILEARIVTTFLLPKIYNFRGIVDFPKSQIYYQRRCVNRILS